MERNSSLRRRIGRLLAGVAATFASGSLIVALGSPVFAQAAGAREDLVTKLTGKRVHLDRTTGQLRAITADEARALIDTVLRATDSSAAPNHTPAQSAAGHMLHLGDHTGHIVVARPNEDGSTALRCVGSADEAVGFLTEEGLPLQ